MALINKLSAIGDAIREKSGTTDLMTLDEMPEAIAAIETGGGGGDEKDLFKEHIDNTITTVSKNDLKGLTKLTDFAFYHRNNLSTVELPDTITTINRNSFYGCSNLTNIKMPNNNNLTMGNSVFEDCARLKTITLYETPPTVTDSTFDTRYLTNIYVPGPSYELYQNTSYFASKYIGLLTPNSSYVGNIMGPPALAWNDTYIFSLKLICFDEAPTNYSIASSDNEVVQIVNIEPTTTEIKFAVAAMAFFEGTATITATCMTPEGIEYTREFTVATYETLPESYYEVQSVENASYGFELNADGYYMSQNKGISNSAALCKVYIFNPTNRAVYFDLINSGEANYDYGIFSKVNETLGVTSSEDPVSVVQYNYKGKSSTEVVTATYQNPGTSCYIYVKFRKDGSGDQGNDTLQFKVRFGD